MRSPYGWDISVFMIKGALITDAMISQPIPDVGNASGMGSPFLE